MGILDGFLSDDLVTLTDPDLFGEQVIYNDPDGGASRTIWALVIREGTTGNGGDRVATNRFEVITSADPNVGLPVKPVRNRGTITVARDVGGTPAPYLIVEVVTQDGGGWHLKLKGA